MEINRAQLQEALLKPDWYVPLEEYLRQEIFPVVHDNPEVKRKRHEFYELVEEMLAKENIPLAKNGPDWDAGRKPTDTIIIHHTEEEPWIKLTKLSAIGFVRQYAKKYLESPKLRGKAIWSGHFKDDQMVFFAYHWLIRPDGQKERLLEDKHIAWHAEGKSNTIGIAFSGNYEHSSPPIKQIKAAAEIIRSYYDHVDKAKILGHREVMSNRTCPGDQFLPKWKQTLLQSIYGRR